MPLTHKGEEILHNMEKEHGEKAGEREFYASKNKGVISGVDYSLGAAKAEDVSTSPYYGDPVIDPTQTSSGTMLMPDADQPSGMKESIDSRDADPPGVKHDPHNGQFTGGGGGSGGGKSTHEQHAEALGGVIKKMIAAKKAGNHEEVKKYEEEHKRILHDPKYGVPSRESMHKEHAEKAEHAKKSGDPKGQKFHEQMAKTYKDSASDEMSSIDQFAAIGAMSEQSDTWSRMTGNRDFRGDENSRMGKLPTEVSHKDMQRMAEGFNYNQGYASNPYGRK